MKRINKKAEKKKRGQRRKSGTTVGHGISSDPSISHDYLAGVGHNLRIMININDNTT